MAASKLAKKLKLESVPTLSDLESDGDWLDPDDSIDQLRISRVEATVIGWQAEAGDVRPADSETEAQLHAHAGTWLNAVASTYGYICVPAQNEFSGEAEAVVYAPQQFEYSSAGGDSGSDATLVLEQLRMQGALADTGAVPEEEQFSPDHMNELVDWLSAVLSDSATPLSDSLAAYPEDALAEEVGAPAAEEIFSEASVGWQTDDGTLQPADSAERPEPPQVAPASTKEDAPKEAVVLAAPELDDVGCGTDGDQICPSEHRALKQPRIKPLKVWAPSDDRTETANGRQPQLVQIHGDLAVKHRETLAREQLQQDVECRSFACRNQCGKDGKGRGSRTEDGAAAGCCGDGACDGPENVALCPVDCAEMLLVREDRLQEISEQAGYTFEKDKVTSLPASRLDPSTMALLQKTPPSQEVADIQERQGAPRTRSAKEIQELQARARRASRAVKCNMCIFLLQDLWAKVLGIGAFGMTEQTKAGEESYLGDSFTTEDAIITAVEKTCGMGNPVPFRGAYLLEEAEDCAVQPLPGCGHKGFSLRRRIPMLPPAIVPLSWRTDAMKLACIDLADGADVEIAEAFYRLTRGRRNLVGQAMREVRAREKDMIGGLCAERCEDVSDFAKDMWRKGIVV